MAAPSPHAFFAPAKQKVAGLSEIDWRTRSGKLIKRVRADLIQHVGGQPSAVERQLIERAALLSVHIGSLDAKAIEAGGMNEHDRKAYLAFSNSLARLLRQLGLKGGPDQSPRLTDPSLSATLSALRSARSAAP